MVYLVRVFPIGGTDKVMKNCAKVPDACNEGAVPPSAFTLRGGGWRPASCPVSPCLYIACSATLCRVKK